MPRQEVGSAINYLANYEVKAVGYVALYTEGESTTSSLGKAIADHSGIIVCKSIVKTYLATYLKGGFASVREGVGGNGRRANFYEVANEEIGLPVIGTLLEWADKHNHSLTSVLSATSSKGQSRGPLNKVQIIDGLLKGMNVSSMELPGYRPTWQGWGTSHNTSLKTLVSAGLVEIEDDPNEFKILDPTYRGTKQFMDLKPETQATYHVLRVAKEVNAERSWTVQQLIELAADLLLVDKQRTTPLHYSLLRAISTSTPRYFPGAVQKRQILPRQYLLAEDFKAAAADLMERLAKVDEGTLSVIKEKTDFATDSYADSETAAKIIQRGIDTSPYT